jgi:hypothetical protein
MMQEQTHDQEFPMDFRIIAPYILDQYLAESARRAEQRARRFADQTPRARRSRVT